METRFYAADLAAYNNGRLHGAWIDATSDEDEMKEAVAAMLRKSPYPNVTVECPECDGAGCAACNGEGEVPSAEEWLIHDYDDPARAISHLGETSDLSEIAEIMEAVEEIENDHDENRLPLLMAWLADHCSSPSEWADKLSDAYAGEYSDPEDYAADLASDCGYLENVPEALRGYIDFRAWARDMALGGEIDFIDLCTGDHLQSYDDMRGRECLVLRNL